MNVNFRAGGGGGRVREAYPDGAYARLARIKAAYDPRTMAMINGLLSKGIVVLTVDSGRVDSTTRCATSARLSCAGVRCQPLTFFPRSPAGVLRSVEWLPTGSVRPPPAVFLS